MTKKTSENLFVGIALAWPLLMALLFYVFVNIQSLMLNADALTNKKLNN